MITRPLFVFWEQLTPIALTALYSETSTGANVANTASPNTVDSLFLNLLDYSTFELRPPSLSMGSYPCLFSCQPISFPSGTIFVKSPHLISTNLHLITIHSPLGKPDHVLLCWTYTSALPQPPPPPLASMPNQLQSLPWSAHVNTLKNVPPTTH